MAQLGENSTVGTRAKINMYLPLPGDNTLENTDWEVKIFVDTNPKSIIVKKADCVKVNADNYIIPIDSALLGAGKYYATVDVRIPDGTFPDGIRVEKRTKYVEFTADAK